MTADYKQLDRGGKVITSEGLPAYCADLKKLGTKMEITSVAIDGGTAWCQWQVGEVIGAGMISFSDEGVSQEQLYYP